MVVKTLTNCAPILLTFLVFFLVVLYCDAESVKKRRSAVKPKHSAATSKMKGPLMATRKERTRPTCRGNKCDPATKRQAAKSKSRKNRIRKKNKVKVRRSVENANARLTNSNEDIGFEAFTVAHHRTINRHNNYHEHPIMVQLGEDQYGDCNLTKNFNTPSRIGNCLEFAEGLRRFFYRRWGNCYYMDRVRGWFRAWPSFCDIGTDTAHYSNDCRNVHFREDENRDVLHAEYCIQSMERDAKSHIPYAVEFNKDSNLKHVCFVTFLTPIKDGRRRHAVLAQCNTMLPEDPNSTEEDTNYCYAVYLDASGETTQSKYNCAKGRRMFTLEPKSEYSETEILEGVLDTIKV